MQLTAYQILEYILSKNSEKNSIYAEFCICQNQNIELFHPIVLEGKK